MAETLSFFFIIFISIFVGLLAIQVEYDREIVAVEEYEISEYQRIFNMSKVPNTLNNMFSLFTQMHNLSVRHESHNERKINNLKLYIALNKKTNLKESALLKKLKVNLETLANRTRSLAEQINPTAANNSLNSLERKIIETNKEMNETKTRIDEMRKSLSNAQSENEEKARRVKELEAEIESNRKQILKLKSSQAGKSEEFKSEIEKFDIQIRSCTSCCRARSCTTFGRSTDIHMIHVNQLTGAFDVACNGQLAEAGPGWTVIQRRFDGSENFYRNWLEYKEGFGNLTGEFFIGLEKLHHMTTEQPHELFIHLEDFSNESRFARYSNFVVASEKDSYKLQSLGTFSGEAGNALEYNVGCGFSTYDKGDEIENANSLHGGWWYESDGSLSNLNGRYIPNGETIFDYRGQSVFWYSDWHDDDYSFKSVQMMIRPSSYDQLKILTQ